MSFFLLSCRTSFYGFVFTGFVSVRGHVLYGLVKEGGVAPATRCYRGSASFAEQQLLKRVAAARRETICRGQPQTRAPVF